MNWLLNAPAVAPTGILLHAKLVPLPVTGQFTIVPAVPILTFTLPLRVFRSALVVIVQFTVVLMLVVAGEHIMDDIFVFWIGAVGGVGKL